MDQIPPPTLPRLSRAFSVPLPSQLGYLKNPRRILSESPINSPPPGADPPVDFSHFHELSLELADSVQMVIQTLLQLSPPQVLDPAKEQFSACSLPIPTPSISAMFTAMKNLNYMSANLEAFSRPQSSSPRSGSSSPLASPLTTSESPYTSPHDFDIGETLQSVGDALSGVAAEAGVDLVLYHGDVGMKHVAVKGAESGISYTLSHIIRQIISAAHRGDAVEVGLFIVAPALNAKDSDPSDSTQAVPDVTDPDSLYAIPDPDKPLRCTFTITHVFAPSDSMSSSADNSAPSASREPPSLKTHILDRLLEDIHASFRCEDPTDFTGRSCQLTVVLDRGSPAVVNPAVVLAEDDPMLNSSMNVRISGEPTLEDLAQFTESLRGKKVSLYASSKGQFARHLTSYLTAWGLDVSHFSADSDVEGSPERQEKSDNTPIVSNVINEVSFGGGSTLETLPEQGAGAAPVTNPQSSPQTSPSFVLIDDDISVLRERLRKLREQQYPLHLGSRKRPSLSAQHRPRSSPQVTRAMGLGGPAAVQVTSRSAPVIIHFTSLSNFKLVKGILQSTLAPNGNSLMRLPEVIVIPKPAGPRRVLTALHTAATRPIVDPFFTPIATSPYSPGIHPNLNYFNQNMSPRSPLSRPSGSPRSNSDRAQRSPKDHIIDGSGLAPPSPLGLSEGMDYFSEAAIKLGTSPSSGLVIQSPDGQPAGIFFHPRARGARLGSAGVSMERDRGFFGIAPERPSGRRASDADGRPRGNVSFLNAANNGATVKRSPRLPVALDLSSPEVSDSARSAKKAPPMSPTVETGESHPIPSAENSSTPFDSPVEKSRTPRGASMRKDSPVDTLRRVNSPPTSPRTTVPSGTGSISRRGTTRRPNVDGNMAPPPAAQTKKAKGPPDGNIIPPISVLIVDDNPINQTILSTFMKKRKITFDVAKNGEEAVTKWKSGRFHLILMDIQMPVMDGISATKEIRRLEKVNASQGYPSSTPSSEGQRTPRTPSEAASSDTRMSASPYRSSVIIVALTASSLQSDRVNALAAGCNDFLTKPVSLIWLNSKIIEWGSIKALQMWADIHPEVVKTISSGQTVQAQNIARRLHVPEGRASPTASPSRSNSQPRTPLSVSPMAPGVTPMFISGKMGKMPLTLAAGVSKQGGPMDASSSSTPTTFNSPLSMETPLPSTADEGASLPGPGPSSTGTAEGEDNTPVPRPASMTDPSAGVESNNGNAGTSGVGEPSGMTSDNGELNAEASIEQGHAPRTSADESAELSPSSEAQTSSHEASDSPPTTPSHDGEVQSEAPP
ncbi:hypothetical protein EWM64_g3378 [Hericium alpestre]|uniref:Response regulatory domain-containing protein n=1 Tax=Hericium alpestre TaxID=135208 RepID=A0A4Z0A2F0_9AGAM|nr:hypothetical protein EWM64_g3378 [Hericium alpestre]